MAVNCIAESFKVDPNDKAAVSQAIGSQSLAQIYSVYEKLKDAGKSSAAPSSSGSTAPSQPTAEQKKEAESLKSRGNAAMANKDYAAAIDFYTRALQLDPGNAVFLSNRAAAHSAARDHESARADAEAATAADPTYSKAWSRLGLARFALGDARGSMEAYRRGIEVEGSGGSEAMRKGFETAKKRVEEMEADEAEVAAAARGGNTSSGGGPSLADLAGMFGGGRGGGAGGGGLPDFSQIMNNPMFASMAQSLMNNPELMSNLINNPRLRELAERMGSGGGMPDIASLMSDPSIAEM